MNKKKKTFFLLFILDMAKTMKECEKYKLERQKQKRECERKRCECIKSHSKSYEEAKRKKT